MRELLLGEARVNVYEALVWDRQVRAMLDRLRSERAQTRSPSKRAALQALIIYVRNQDNRLAYDRSRAAGLDIGSGRGEAACKRVVGLRMKRSGMRWSARGSQNTHSLRVPRLNGDGNRLWSRHPLARAA